MKNNALIIIVLNFLLIPLRALGNVNETAIDTQVKYKALQESTCVVESYEEAVIATFWKQKHSNCRPIKRKIRMRRSAPRCPGFYSKGPRNFAAPLSYFHTILNSEIMSKSKSKLSLKIAGALITQFEWLGFFW